MAEIPLPAGAVYRGGTHSALAALRAREEAAGTFAPSVFSPDTLVDKGLVRVAHKRVPLGKNKKPSADALSKGAKLPTEDAGFDLYYERHGNGPRKVVYIMGLNNSCFGWLGQVERFGADEQYSVLVLDNRGYGNSDTPAGPYSTSEMALDVLELCDHVGWKEERQLNVVGVSMGGMIALEIAKTAPQRVASLSLISTTSGQGRGEKNILTSLPPLSGVKTISRILAGRILNLDSDQYRVERVCDMLFPAPWLDEKDPEDSSRTRRENFCEMFKWRFAFTRRQTIAGAFAQLRAVATHRVTSAQLRRINEQIPAMCILTGDEDNLVNPANSEFLHKHLPKAEYHVFKRAGHALPVQLPTEVNAALAQNFERAAAATSS